MNIEELRSFCIEKKGVEEGFPFGSDIIVFKVMGKVFLIADLQEQPLTFNVKCDPEKAVELRERYSCITPGYHMNKKHWNTIVSDGSVSSALIKEWVSDSYNCVIAKLPKAMKKELENL
jgi:predicted DNA-binding protein (MmcQ/YjbR family)